LENNIEMRRSNGSLQESYLETIEQFLELKLPKSYRIFLLKYNGGEPIKNVFFYKEDKTNGSIIDRFFGLVSNKYENLLVYLRTYRERIPLNMIPIAYDPGGNLILISVKSKDRGKIYFWDHEMEVDDGETPDYSNLTLIADSFDEFIEGLYSIDEVSDDI
jgi:hypothetical protein